MFDQYGDPKPSAFVAGGLVLVALIAGLIGFFSAATSIDTGKVGVVTSYGRVTGRELDSGFSWVSPFGIESVTQYDVKTQKEQQSSAAATKDLQDVQGTVVLNYHLERGKVSEIHKTVGANYKGVLISPAIQETFKASTAQYTANELVNNRAQVKSDVTVGLRERLADRGIVVEDVSIVNLQYSPEFTKAIEDRQVAQQQAERAKYNLERAKLDAQAQEAQKTSLSDNLLRKQELDNQSDWIKKWNGSLPTTVAGGDTQFLLGTK